MADYHLDPAAVAAAVRDVVVAATGWHESRVIHADQAAPPPREPYATARVTSAAPIGRPEEGDLDADGVQLPDGDKRRKQHWRLVVVVEFYGPGAFAAASRLATVAWSSEEIGAYLQAAALAFVGIAGGPRNMTALLETTFRERAGNDLVFATAAAWTETVGHITAVGVTGEATKPAGDPVPLDASETV